jgi:hypothetical protein
LRLALSKGPHRVGATPSPPLFKEKHRKMDKVLKQDSSKCITPSSEPFRTDKEEGAPAHNTALFIIMCV